jgi:hypothetical protein
MVESFYKRYKMREWPYNRDSYVKNPQMWIKHYIEVFEYQKTQRMKNPLYRLKLALYKLKRRILK